MFQETIFLVMTEKALSTDHIPPTSVSCGKQMLSNRRFVRRSVLEMAGEQFEK